MDVDEQDETVQAGEIAPSSNGGSTEILSSEEVAPPSSTVNTSSAKPDDAKADGETITQNITEETMHKPANNDTQLVENSDEESVATNRGNNAEAEGQSEDIFIDGMTMFEFIARFNTAYGTRSNSYEFEWSKWAAED